MPTYTYRREDGTTFDIRQKFSDDPLEVDPQTGQKVTRVIQSAGVIFKGSGFYVTDNRSANNPAAPKSKDSDGASTTTETSSSDSTSTTSSSDNASSSSPAAD
ncbi:MAG: FmdB family zinc ribbon protein [Chloroflexota bacterium]